MIKLYDYWRSSASYRVRIALGVAGEGWTSVPVNLAEGEQDAPDYLKLNPQGLVPTIEIDGLRFTQSLAIIEYLDETRNLGLVAGSAVDRARIRALSHAIAMDIHPICNLGAARFAVANSNDGLSMESWMQNFIPPGLRAFEAMLEPGKYCHGDAVTLADICLMPQIYNARRWKLDISAMPRIEAIAKALEQLPAFAAAHPDACRAD